MKPASILLSAIVLAGLAACGQADEQRAAPPSVPSEAAAPAAPAPEVTPAGLTGFTPGTNEIYCRFYRADAAGERGDLLFLTEIAGVPAAAEIGLEGQAIQMQQVSKTQSNDLEIWTYRNADRPVTVELRVKETAKGFESRDFEGSIRITEPTPGPETALTGTCGV